MPPFFHLIYIHIYKYIYLYIILYMYSSTCWSWYDFPEPVPRLYMNLTSLSTGHLIGCHSNWLIDIWSISTCGRLFDKDVLSQTVLPSNLSLCKVCLYIYIYLLQALFTLVAIATESATTHLWMSCVDRPVCPCPINHHKWCLPLGAGLLVMEINTCMPPYVIGCVRVVAADRGHGTGVWTGTRVGGVAINQWALKQTRATHSVWSL